MSFRNGKPVKPGDSIFAADRNARLDAIRRLGQWRGSGGISVHDGVSSRSLSLNLPERIYAKLTSTANGDGGYAWKEVYPTALGTWVDSGRTGSASVDPTYERNGNVSLTATGRVYSMERGVQSSEWLFKHAATGICYGELCFDVVSTCEDVDNASVAVTFGGSPVAGSPFTTNSIGEVCVPISSGGTYSWSVSKYGYVTQSGSTSASCISQVVPITLVLESWQKCCSGAPAPTGSLFMDYGCGTLELYPTDCIWYGSIYHSDPIFPEGAIIEPDCTPDDSSLGVTGRTDFAFSLGFSPTVSSLSIVGYSGGITLGTNVGKACARSPVAVTFTADDFYPFSVAAPWAENIFPISIYE